MVDAYCAGFNAGTRARGWPLILRLIGIRAVDYRPQDMLALFRMLCWFGLSSLQEWPEAVLAQLVAKGAKPELFDLLLGDALQPGELAALPKLTWPDEHDPFAKPVVGAAFGGSNGIVVAKARSQTGGALMCADPHLEVGRIPPLLYASHTAFPDGNYLQGMEVPGLAWPSFGRTPRVGWTYTYAHVDVMDTYALRCRSGECFDGETWRKLTRREIEVRVRGKASERWVFFDSELGTTFGPADGEAEVTLPAIRWCGLRNTAGDFNALRQTLDAQNVEQLLQAQQEIGGLSLFALTADAEGRIGWVLTGRMDERPDHAGGVLPRAPHGVPVPVGSEQRPRGLDPKEGYIVSANERKDGPLGERWVPLPEPRYRHERLSELVRGQADRVGRLSPQDLSHFVHDAVDAGARRLVPIWAPHLPQDPRAERLVRWSTAQPGQGREHYDNLGLFEALHREVCRELIARRSDAAEADRLVEALNAVFLFHHHLDEALALQRPQRVSATELSAALAIAWPKALVAVKGRDARRPVTEPHLHMLFAGKLPGFLGFDEPPMPFVGGATTPAQCRVLTLLGQRAIFGSAARYICDLSQPGGWYSLPGGASERRFGPGYRRGISEWAQGTYAALGPAVAAINPSHQRDSEPNRTV
jgi:penicillin amidase